jgi:hypothetical protein
MRLSGASLDVVVTKFPGVHRDAIHRHMKFHLDEADKKALIDDVPMRELVARAAEEGGSVLDHLSVVKNVVMRALLSAAEAGDRTGTATLSGRAVEVLKEIGRLTGEISSLMAVTNIQNNVAIFNSPQFSELESMLVEKLRDHPAALKAVIEGLQELEARPVPEGLAALDIGPVAAIEHEARP